MNASGTSSPTPGPWLTADTHPITGQPLNVSIRIPGFAPEPAVAIIKQTRSGHVRHIALVPKRNEEDARLIAAAPNLLEACKDMLIEHTHKTEERARAAIVKAGSK